MLRIGGGAGPNQTRNTQANQGQMYGVMGIKRHESPRGLQTLAPDSSIQHDLLQLSDTIEINKQYLSQRRQASSSNRP